MNLFPAKMLCILTLFTSGLKHSVQEQDASQSSHARIDTSSIRIKEITFSERVKEEFFYDEKGNLSEIKCHQDRSSQESRDYRYKIQYDKKNRMDLVESVDKLHSGRYVYLYNKKNQVDLIICFVGGTKYCSISYGYNEKGQVKSKTFTFDQKHRYDYESGVNYEYDSSGNVSKATKVYATNNNDVFGRRFVGDYQLRYAYNGTASLIKQMPVLEFLPALHEIERDEFTGEERFRTNISSRQSFVGSTTQSQSVRREETYSYKTQTNGQNLPGFLERTDGKSYTSSFRFSYY